VSIPLPAGYFAAKIEQAALWLWHLPALRRLKKALAAWGRVDSDTVFACVADYYEIKGLRPFTYPCSPFRVPLYVRPEWLELTDGSLSREQVATERPPLLQEGPQQFFQLYSDIRRELGLAPIWNGRIFRLVKLNSSRQQLSLHFEHGHFFDAVGECPVDRRK
jgi:hypothetical protein